MKSQSCLSLLVCAALFLGSCSEGKKDILLRLKLRPNQKIDIKYRTDILSDKNVSERTENVRMSLKVDKMSPDSTYQFLSKFDYVRVIDDKVLSAEYTSDTDPSQMDAEALKIDNRLNPIIDSLYIFSIDKTGKIVQPFKFDRGTAKTPAENALVDLSIFQVNFPAELVGKGSKWSSESTTTGTNFKRTSKYEVESVYDNTVQLKVEGTVEGAGATETFTGRYHLNKENGQLDSCKIEISGKGKKVISIVSK